MHVSGTEDQASSRQILEEAFQRFSEAGVRLEERYEALKAETDELRAQLAAKDAEIRRAEKLALLGQTAAAVAHEVRNPLGAIRLFASLLEDFVASNPEARGYVREIVGSVSRLDTIVANILHFAADRKAVFAPCNLEVLVREQIATMPIPPGRAPQIHLEVSGSPFVPGNEGELRQVVHNLVLNALQAVRYEGVVQVRIADMPTGVLLEVRDNGPGIPGEVLSTLFEPFVTTRNEGTGLGLAIVRQIVDRHGGEVQAANDRGAVLTVTLPRRISEMGTPEGGERR